MSTALHQEVPGWYIEFQTALLRQAPRPGEIGQDVAMGWMNNQKSLKKALADAILPPPKTSSLLKLVSTVVVPATTTNFIAKDRFVVNTQRNAKVLISEVWDNFTNLFLSGDGKTEDPIGEQTLRYHTLRKSSVDGLIIAELGGKAKAETTLSEMFYLMKKQGKGKDGVLLNNNYVNIFYIKDITGVLRAVSVRWDSGGWDVSASVVEDPNGWSDGYQVFSRNSD